MSDFMTSLSFKKYDYQDFSIKKFQGTLHNGIKYLLFQKKNAPIDFNIAFFAGSAFDKNGKLGMSHLSEHLFAGSTKKFPNKESIQRHFEQMGGNRNAYTSKHTMSFVGNCGGSFFAEQCLDAVEEIVCHPLLLEEEFDREKKVVLQEYRQSFSSQDGIAWDEFYSLACKDSPFAHTVLGDESGIEGTEWNDAKEWHKHAITADNAIFVFAGDIDHDWLVKRLERFPVQRGSYLRKAEEIGLPKPASLVTPDPQAKDVKIRIGFRTCTELNKKEMNALAIAATMLASSATSYLYRKLRSEHSYVYGVSASAFSNYQFGVFVIGTSLAKEHLNHSLELIKEGIDWLKEGKFIDEDLQHEKTYIAASIPSRFENAVSMISAHLWESLHHFDTPFSVFEDYENAYNVTREDIMEVCKKYLVNDRLYSVFRGNMDGTVEFHL